MLYLVDSANTKFIKEMLSIYNVQGVTTNPTIITKEKKEYTPLLKELEALLPGKDLHIQLVSEKYDDMIKEAYRITKPNNNYIHLKIPVSKDGFRAIKYLSDNGFSCTATAVCTVNQGIMAALQGAEYIAVYVNRISNSGLDGNLVIKDIKEYYQRNKIVTKIIGASYKSIHQITDSIRYGVDQVTVGIDLFEKLFDSEITNNSIKQFTKDFNALYQKKEGV